MQLQGEIAPSCPLCRNQETHLLLSDPLPFGWTRKIYRCTSCGSGFASPMPSPEQIAQFYNADYFTFLETGMVTRLRMKRIRKFLLQLAAAGRLLDVGCGTGEFMELMRKIGFEVEGIELSPYAVVRAKAKGLAVWEGDFETLSSQLPANHYDIITMLDVIEHLPNPAEALSLSHRLLKAGGWIFLHTPDYTNVLLGTHLYIITKEWERVHLVYFTPEGLETILNRCGFQKVKVFRCPPFPPGPPCRSLRSHDLSLWRKVGKALIWIYKWATKSLLIAIGVSLPGAALVAWGQKPVE